MNGINPLVCFLYSKYSEPNCSINSRSSIFIRAINTVDMAVVINNNDIQLFRDTPKPIKDRREAR